MYLSVLDLKPFRLYVKGKDSSGKEIQSLVVQQDNLSIETSL